MMWKKGATVQQNYEWYMYLRPKVAMSEMGENCSKNVNQVPTLMTNCPLDKEMPKLKMYKNVVYPETKGECSCLVQIMLMRSVSESHFRTAETHLKGVPV